MAFGLPSQEEIEAMFGFVTPEDRARWQQEQRQPETPEQRAGQKRMFARMAEGVTSSGQRIADGRMTAEQTGRSVSRSPRTVTRVITERVSAKEDLDADFDY